MEPKPAAAASRRSLLGVAGLTGAAAVLIAGQRAAASATAPTSADAELLSQALQAELAARDLYRLTVEAGAGDDVFDAFAENHRGYAQAIAASIGEPAQGRDDELYGQYESDFDSSDATSVASTAYELEQQLVASHLEFLDQYESSDAVTLGSSILVVEGRQAAVLADVAGNGSDLDALLGSMDPATGGGSA